MASTVKPSVAFGKLASACETQDCSPGILDTKVSSPSTGINIATSSLDTPSHPSLFQV